MNDRFEQDEPKRPAEKPISLAPLKFEEAVEGLLRVSPKAIDKGKNGV